MTMTASSSCSFSHTTPLSRALLLLVSVTLLLQQSPTPGGVQAFAVPSTITQRQIVARPFSTHLSVASSLPTNNTNDSDDNDAVLKQFHKKQARLNKKVMEAEKALSAAKSSMQRLESKKREYLNGSSLGSNKTNFSETTLRSAVKAFCWRIIAGSVTFVTSLRFSGSLTTALSIVGSDFFSQAFTMFIGERLMNKSPAGRKSGADDIGRSLTKALVWRLFAIANTLTMALFVAKDLKMASKIAGSDAFFKTGLMFAYERVWAKIEWGKEYQVDFFI